MSAKRRRLSKKEYARLLRQRADEEARARSESADRQERIKILWQELRKKSDRAKELARDDLGGTLLELVGLQREEINYMRPDHELCEWAETHAADELAALRKKHLEKHPFMRVLRAVVARATHLTSKQASERRRTQIRRKKVGLIEYEFGGQAEARAGFLGPALHTTLQTCLDDILMGYGVDMQYLEALFGLERHRFPNKLPKVRDGRKILYGAFAVVEIMDALLEEKLPERKPGARGGSEKKLWLSTPEVRKRVLMEIGWRALALSRYREILGLFMTVVYRHFPSGDSEERLPKDAEDKLRAHIRSIPFLGSLSATCPDSGK